MIRSLVDSKRRYGYAFVLLLFLAGCGSGQINTTGSGIERGNKLIADDAILNLLKPGITTKGEVASILGEPMASSLQKSTGDTGWLYQYVKYPIVYQLGVNFNSEGVLKPKPDGLIKSKTVYAPNGKTLHTYD